MGNKMDATLIAPFREMCRHLSLSPAPPQLNIIIRLSKKEGKCECVYIQCDTYTIRIIINAMCSASLWPLRVVISTPLRSRLIHQLTPLNYGYIREYCEPNHLVFVCENVNNSINLGIAWIGRGERIGKCIHYTTPEVYTWETHNSTV